MNSNELISDAIKMRLLRTHKTQRDICLESGITPSTFRLLMKGSRGWTIQLLDMIAPALNFASAVEIVKAAQQVRLARENS